MHGKSVWRCIVLIWLYTGPAEELSPPVTSSLTVPPGLPVSLLETDTASTDSTQLPTISNTGGVDKDAKLLTSKQVVHIEQEALLSKGKDCNNKYFFAVYMNNILMLSFWYW